MRRTPPLGQNQAFSLTELLVGVVIGGLLVGLAAPAVQGALDKSKQSKDLSNLRQIGQGITLFSGENDGRLPPSSCKAETQEELELSWIYSLRDYLGQNYDDLRLSPSDPHRETRRKFKNTSYLINEEVDGNGSLSRVQRIDRPSQRMLLFLASDSKNPRGQEDHIHSAYMGGWNRLLGEIKPDAYRGRRTDRTVGSSPYLFADGHVEMIPATRIKQFVDSGKNLENDSL
ncbi:MAG: type II secretion system protein [Solirubrobacterales bacterium]